MNQILLVLLLALIIGCAPPPYEVPTVTDAPRLHIAVGTETKLVHLEAISLIDDPSRQVGVKEVTPYNWFSPETSEDCIMLQDKLSWNEFIGFVETKNLSEKLVKAFERELAQAHVAVAGDLRSQFKDLPDSRPDVVVRATVVDLRTRYCWPRSNMSSEVFGKVWLKIDWDILSDSGNKLRTIKLQSVGGAQSSEQLPPGEFIIRSFSQATRGLLANDSFADLVR